MSRLAARMGQLGTETAFAVLAEVQRLEAAGRSVINFAIGEPDFATPDHIKQAGIEALLRNETHYSPSAGIWPLRRAIARHVAETRGIDVEPQEVVVTPGAKPIIFYSILALIEPGDEVIYPNPGFPIYESVIRFAGARPVPAPLSEANGFRLDVQALTGLITDRTRMVIINSPHNPTGSVLTRDDLEALAKLARRHDLWVLADEIYSRIVFDGPAPSIAALPGMRERTIILDGFSKIYAMTGWRLGYGVMPAFLAEAVARLVTNNESCTATFTQYAGLAALEGPQDATRAMVAEFRARRDMIVQGLNDIPGIRCRVPGGAFYVFPNVTDVCQRLGLRDSRALQERLLAEAGVAVLARSAFGAPAPGETQQYIRLSYATSRDNIAEGLRRLRAFVGG
ncbi:MAG TPA: pyridoxal phosphate-dependent aminotransferase [Limnochordales bacterium]|nr:pyridoxal phosphate-dependent aminotransferase [Limnochordales bacterium]